MRLTGGSARVGVICTRADLHSENETVCRFNFTVFHDWRVRQYNCSWLQSGVEKFFWRHLPLGLPRHCSFHLSARSSAPTSGRGMSAGAEAGTSAPPAGMCRLARRGRASALASGRAWSSAPSARRRVPSVTRRRFAATARAVSGGSPSARLAGTKPSGRPRRTRGQRAASELALARTLDARIRRGLPVRAFRRPALRDRAVRRAPAGRRAQGGVFARRHRHRQDLRGGARGGCADEGQAAADAGGGEQDARRAGGARAPRAYPRKRASSSSSRTSRCTFPRAFPRGGMWRSGARSTTTSTR